MRLTIELPNDLMQHANPAREALEALAIEGYRIEAFSHFQASELLGLTRLEFDGYLIDHHIDDHAYSQQDLTEDIEVTRQLRARLLVRV